MVTSAHGTDGLLETPVGWRGIFIQVVDSFSKPISGILNIFRKVSIFLRVKSLAFCIKKLFQKALLERKNICFQWFFRQCEWWEFLDFWKFQAVICLGRGTSAPRRAVLKISCQNMTNQGSKASGTWGLDLCILVKIIPKKPILKFKKIAKHF